MAEIIVRQPIAKNDIKAVLGDGVSSDFIPRLKLTRWDGEASFGVEHDPVGIPIGHRTYTVDNEKHIFDTPPVNFRRGY
jgi:hypothetical protein